MKDDKYIGDSTKIKAHYQKWLSTTGTTPRQDAYLKRIRGYELEKLIYSILHNENLNPTTGLQPDGEQIDGSFIFGNSYFLIEAKWHEKEI